jgi:uncharacterized membrane protein YgcG
MSILKRIRDKHKLAEALRQRGHRVPPADTDEFDAYIVNLYAGAELTGLIDEHLETASADDSFVFDSPDPGGYAGEGGASGGGGASGEF